MEPKPTEILLITDKPEDVALVRHHLPAPGASSDAYALRSAARLSSGCQLLAKQRFDVVLLDLAVPYCVGLEALHKVSRQSPRTPVLVLSGFQDEDLAVQAVEEGAQGYLLKGVLDGPLLRLAIRYAIERKGLLSRIERLESELEAPRPRSAERSPGASGRPRPGSALSRQDFSRYSPTLTSTESM